MKFKKQLFTVVCIAVAVMLAGCVGGNTNIEPQKLADKIVEKFELQGLTVVDDAEAQNTYGLVIDVPGEGVEQYEIRVGEEIDDARLLAVVKAKNEEGAEQAEDQLRMAAAQAAHEDDVVVVRRNGMYVFAAAGRQADSMAEEFDRLTK